MRQERLTLQHATRRGDLPVYTPEAGKRLVQHGDRFAGVTDLTCVGTRPLKYRVGSMTAPDGAKLTYSTH